MCVLELVLLVAVNSLIWDQFKYSGYWSVLVSGLGSTTFQSGLNGVGGLISGMILYYEAYGLDTGVARIQG